MFVVIVFLIFQEWIWHISKLLLLFIILTLIVYFTIILSTWIKLKCFNTIIYYVILTFPLKQIILVIILQFIFVNIILLIFLSIRDYRFNEDFLCFERWEHIVSEVGTLENMWHLISKTVDCMWFGFCENTVQFWYRHGSWY